MRSIVTGADIAMLPCGLKSLHFVDCQFAGDTAWGDVRWPPKLHFVPEPWMSDVVTFGGWGDGTLVSVHLEASRV